MGRLYLRANGVVGRVTAPQRHGGCRAKTGEEGGGNLTDVETGNVEAGMRKRDSLA